jgi:deoxyribodipyrimidine photolyase-like uncharacterized protein
VYDYSGEKLLKRLFLPGQKAKELFACKLYDSYGIVRNVQFPASEREFDKFLDTVVKARNEAFGDWATESDALYADLLQEGNPEQVEVIE